MWGGSHYLSLVLHNSVAVLSFLVLPPVLSNKRALCARPKNMCVADTFLLLASK